MASIIRSFTPAAQPRSSWWRYVSHAIRVMSQMFRCVSGAVPKRQEKWKSESESSTNLSVHPIKESDRPSSRNLGFMSCNDMMSTWKWSYTNNNNKKNYFYFKEIIRTFMFLLDKSRKRIQSRQVPHSLPLRAPNSVDNYAAPLTESLWCEDQPRQKEDKEDKEGIRPGIPFFSYFRSLIRETKLQLEVGTKKKQAKLKWGWQRDIACILFGCVCLRPGFEGSTALVYIIEQESWAGNGCVTDRSSSFSRGVAITTRSGGRTLDFYYSSERPCFLAATAGRRQTRWRSALKNEALHLKTALCNYYAYKVRLQPRTQACKADGGKHCLSAPITSTRTTMAATRQANNTTEVILFF